jgi:oxygen-dependent protoporphyrinogen oxidase
MKSVAIIGAGITGLTAAFYLKRAGVPVTVFEAGPRAGGSIQSVRQDGYLAEFGPNTILETSPKIAQLIRDAGLESRRLEPDPKAAARFVVRYKRPIAMPGSPLGFLTTKLFTLPAKLAVLREPFVPARRDGVEESIAGFVVRRLGREFLDHAIDAMVAGVYAGDPAKLSVQQAFPKLAALEAKYGSLIKGQILGARERRKRGEIAKDRAPTFSFDEGLQVLPDTLRERLGDAVQLNTSVTKLTQTAHGWTLDLRTKEGASSSEHSAVIYAGTAHKLGELQVELRACSKVAGDRGNGRLARLDATHPNRESCATHGRDAHAPCEESHPDLTPFSEIRHPPVASVVLGFRREDVAHPCEGFGALIPNVEGFKILGTLFSSSLFPNRAPAGHVTLTSYIGGERHPELASLPPEELFELTQQDLRVLLGVKGRPTFRHAAFFPKAIPQYNVGYGRFRGLMTELETQAPNLFFAGHYRDGISLGDSIVSGCNIAERVAKAIVA